MEKNYIELYVRHVLVHALALLTGAYAGSFVAVIVWAIIH